MKVPNDIQSSEITPEATFQNRRFFMKGSILAGSALATTGLYHYFRGNPDAGTTARADIALAQGPDAPMRIPALPADEPPNSLAHIGGYNNFYEFATDKLSVAEKAKNFVTSPWQVEVGGLVGKGRTFGLEELLKLDQEERIYRFRCVEGWSMVIPWVGFPLSKLLAMVEPQAGAKYVAFETYMDVKQMPDSGNAGIELPYVEGLRLDEAMHPLTILATGLYGKTLPNQNGAPIRLVVPWKYGFKSIKSVVKITLTDKEPPITWNKAIPDEYGFYSNVNPTVDHPRWSQATERRIGEIARRKTLMFNGYEEQVAALYKGMDLRKYF
jgi:methionine sulfoxide reductase catalytic subunit